MGIFGIAKKGLGLLGKKKKFTSAGLDSPVIKSVKPSVPKTGTEKGISIMRKLNQRVRATNSRLKQQIFETKQKMKEVEKSKRNKATKDKVEKDIEKGYKSVVKGK